MNNEQLIRRTLAEAGMELPSGPIPAKLIEDLDSTPAPAGATAAPAPLVVGKKYKQTKGNPRVWWFDGTTTLSDSSSFPEAPARPSIHYATVDSFLAAIASGELVPADEPAADIHKELVMDTAKKMVAWGEVHVVEETTPERFDEFTGQMPSCPFCKGVHAANDCPTHGTPLSDPASVAIAAHNGQGERFGCRIVRDDGDGRGFNVLDTANHWLSSRGGWFVECGDINEVASFWTESEARAALAKAPPPPGWVEPKATPSKLANTDLTDTEWSNLLSTIEEYRTASGALGIVLSRQLRVQIDMLLLRRAYGKGGV